MTSTEQRMARTFGLRGEAAWLRHANPWSVYTRIPGTAALVAGAWTSAWIGWWSLVPVGVVAVWLAVNPVVFPPPVSTDHWASRAVLGETYWADRKRVPVPPRHRVAPTVLTAVNALGLPFIVWGLIDHDLWIVLFGLAVQTAGKLWFLDRMALLHDDMAAAGDDHGVARSGNDRA